MRNHVPSTHGDPEQFAFPAIAAFFHGLGVFSCGLVLHCSLGAGRVAPEALVFLSSALALFAPGKNSVRSARGAAQITLQRVCEGICRIEQMWWGVLALCCGDCDA